MIATCPLCRNTGAVGERYCTCEAALALRSRIDNNPRVQELRAKIDRLLGDAEEHQIFVHVGGGIRVLHPGEPEYS